jgi:hypothetical protein
MTPEQETHLQEIKDSFCLESDDKYRHGAQTHGGELQEMPALQLVDESLAEAIDAYVYLKTLRPKVEELTAEVARLRHENAGLRDRLEARLWL